MNKSADMQVLHDHIERFNAGVTLGDFRPMVEAFSEDAEMTFEGVPVGPFRGRDAIGAAYRERPPDDQIKILDASEPAPGEIVAEYAWAGQPATRSGEMRLSHRDGQITRLVVTFDTPATGG
jgi:steroid Delta-isomerase